MSDYQFLERHDQPEQFFSSERERSIQLFPESEYLQREWIRAVSVVRSTQNGWVMDNKVSRQ